MDKVFRTFNIFMPFLISLYKKIKTSTRSTKEILPYAVCDMNRYYLQSVCVASHHCPNPASFCARLRKHLIIIIIIINTLHFLQPQALPCFPAVLNWAVKRVLTIIPRESNARSSERVWRRAAFFSLFIVSYQNISLPADSICYT